MNGYFQLLLQPTETDLIIFPPTEDGEIVNTAEVLEYLQSRGITYELSTISTVVNTAKEKTIVKLNNETRLPEPESVKVIIAPDKMKAVGRFYPPSEGNAPMSISDILEEFTRQKIIFGVDQEIMNQFADNREYCTDITVANGMQPIHGEDAFIEHFFNTDIKARPTLKDDGGVDFFNLNTINHCKQGDLLAKLHAASVGRPGVSILGERIKPRDVKRDVLKYGNNITISEDKTEITSQVDGHVLLVSGKVFVSNVMEVENVDIATGNITYEGSVQINGNACSGYFVKAKGNVEVRGVVEAAFIQAGGDIIIARGMNGMGKGVLRAGGNVISKFIENATVISGGYVETGSILHSRVFAKTEINVSGKRGFITGGNVSATNAVNVKTLGSAMGADTIVEVGTDPSLKAKIQELQKTNKELEKEVQLIQPVLEAFMEKINRRIKLPPDQVQQATQIAQEIKQKQEQMKEASLEIKKMHDLLYNNSSACVVVTGEVYAGTKIVISESSMIVRDTMQYCRFVKQQGDVKMTSI